MDKILVIGGGSWGTSFANYLTQKFSEIRLWIREDEVRNAIRSKQENTIFLPGQQLSEKLIPVANLEQETKMADCLIMAVPSKYIGDTFHQLKGIAAGKQIINLSKGFESHSLKTISQLASNILGAEILNRWTTIY